MGVTCLAVSRGLIAPIVCRTRNSVSAFNMLAVSGVEKQGRIILMRPVALPHNQLAIDSLTEGLLQDRNWQVTLHEGKTLNTMHWVSPVFSHKQSDPVTIIFSD